MSLKELTPEERAQKDLAFSLAGKRLRFAGNPLPGLPPELREPLTIQSISRTGMVTLRGWTGEFAPHLFVVIG